MNAHSSSASPSQASASKFHGSKHMSNEQLKDLNLSLTDTPQILFTQYTDFNASFEPNTTTHINYSTIRGFSETDSVSFSGAGFLFL